MNAIMRVQLVRHTLVSHLNNERTKLANYCDNKTNVIDAIERMQNILKVMLFLQVITQEEADAVGEMIFIEGLHCNTPITLPEVAYGRFGLNYEWDLQETDEAIIKKYWRAQITAFGAKLVRAYKTTNDICQKHDILDVITAGIEAGKLTGALTPSERKQLAQCVQKARQKLSGGIYES